MPNEDLDKIFLPGTWSSIPCCNDGNFHTIFFFSFSPDHLNEIIPNKESVPAPTLAL